MIFKYIEQYVQFLAGSIDANGQSNFISYNKNKSALRLANYDVGVINSIDDQLLMSRALTDRQAVLVDKMIATYAAQMLKLGVEQPNHKNYQYPIRKIDRSYGVFLLENKIHFKFPYVEHVIQQTKEFAKNSQGNASWDPDTRAWIFALTEYNLSWVVAVAAGMSVPLDAEISNLFDRIVECESEPYVIELRMSEDNRLYIHNGPDTMVEYLTQHVGFDDLIKLVDYSGILGYTVSEELLTAVTAATSDTFVSLCQTHTLDQPENIEEVLEWAIAVDRLPIVVYNPNYAKHDAAVFAKYFTEAETLTVKKTMTEAIDVDPTIKLVYTNVVVTTQSGKIPLLISYANLMHGSTKTAFKTNAEKVVYYCTPLPKR